MNPQMDKIHRPALYNPQGLVVPVTIKLDIDLSNPQIQTEFCLQQLEKKSTYLEDRLAQSEAHGQQLQTTLTDSLTQNEKLTAMNREITDYNKRAYTVHLLTRASIEEMRQHLVKTVRDSDTVRKERLASARSQEERMSDLQSQVDKLRDMMD
jgi:chromosome segregation ATPase